MSEGELDKNGTQENQAALPKTGRFARLFDLSKNPLILGLRKNPTVLALSKNPLFLVFLGVIVVALGFLGVRYWLDVSGKIFVENSEIVAPVAALGPDQAGILREVYVKIGDQVTEVQPLFKVGGHTVTSMTPGIVTAVQNTPGQMETPQSAVVKLYDPANLRVVGHLQEDQGLKYVKIGQKVTFTLDAFDSKQYQGVVDTLTPIADTSSVVFSISDKRQEKQFDINVAFDINAYPEIKNGMSAKMWVQK